MPISNRQNALDYGKAVAAHWFIDFVSGPKVQEHRGKNFKLETFHLVMRGFVETGLFMSKRSGKTSKEERKIAGDAAVRKWKSLLKEHLSKRS